MLLTRTEGPRTRDGRLWVVALWVIAITLALLAIKAALD